MRRVPHVQRRGDTINLRIPTLDDLREAVGGRELVKSLGTSFTNFSEQRDPQFSNLNPFSVLHPVAKTTIAELLYRYDNDPTRGAATAKTRLTRVAHLRAIKEFFGADI